MSGLGIGTLVQYEATCALDLESPICTLDIDDCDHGCRKNDNFRHFDLGSRVLALVVCNVVIEVVAIHILSSLLIGMNVENRYFVYQLH
jgi:hypothetical protein